MRNFKSFYKAGNVFERQQEYYKQTPTNLLRNRTYSPRSQTVLRLGKRSSIRSSAINSSRNQGYSYISTSRSSIFSNELKCLLEENTKLKQEVDNIYRISNISEGSESPTANKLNKYSSKFKQNKTILNQYKKIEELESIRALNQQKIVKMESIRLQIMRKMQQTVKIDDKIYSDLNMKNGEQIGRILRVAKEALSRGQDRGVIAALLRKILEVD